MNNRVLAKNIASISKKELGLLYYSSDELEKIISENRAIFLEEDGRPAAFGAWTFREKRWIEVHTLYIWPAFRGKGYLRKVFQEIYKRIAGQGINALLFTFNPKVKHVAAAYNFQKSSLAALPPQIIWRIFLHRIHPGRWFSYLKYFCHPLQIFRFEVYVSVPT